MSTERFESTWRKNVLFVCTKKRQERLLRRTRTHQSLGITVVLRHWRIGPERRSPIERECTVQHSAYSCPGFAKHKEQLQWNAIHSKQCVAISEMRQSRRTSKHRFCPRSFSRWGEQTGRRTANEARQGSGSVRRWPSRQSLRPQKVRHPDAGLCR